MRRAALLALLVCACTEKAKPAQPLPKAVPLEPLVVERMDAGLGEATFTVKPFTFAGEPPPPGALSVEVTGESLKLAGQRVTLAELKQKVAAQTAVVLSFDEETYLAQALGVLALLDDAKARALLQLPEAPGIAWPVQLRDEASFNVWLEESVAGKLRIIQRADGFELQTNLGKLPGMDLKGPSVPTRGGALDLVMLQKGLDKVKAKFNGAPDVCFVPSYGTPMRDATRAVATNWLATDKVVFATACLVYPRPAAGDAGRRP